MPFALLLAILAAPDGGLLTKRANITAEHLDLDSKRQLAEYSGQVKVVRDTTTLTCDRLEVRFGGSGRPDEPDRLLASGNVAAVDGDREAWGDNADYDNRTGVLVVRGAPRGRQGTREVEGETVTFTTGTDALVVSRPHTVSRSETLFSSTGAVQHDGGVPSTVVIDADTLTMQEAKASATWKGHVKVTRGATLITAPELDATWNANGVVTRMLGRGGVDAVEPTRRARGQRADFDLEKGVLVVTGHPEAHQGKNHVRGSRVTFLSDSDLVEVENPVTIIEQEKKGR